MASPGALFYIPEPYERPYYDGLFQAADTNRSGNIGGQEAVAFFSRSKLPLEQLKNVWTVADNPPSNSLNRPKFAVAIRLIQLLQNGVKGKGSNLAVPTETRLRPVFLEGISGAVVPLPGQQQQQHYPPQQRPVTPQSMPPGRGPPQQQMQPTSTQQLPTLPEQQQPLQQLPQQRQQPSPHNINAGGRPPMIPHSPGHGNMALTVPDPYTLVPNERARYELIFPQYAKEDGYMHGKEAVELFSKSGLSQTVLRDIWNMADQPVDNRLDMLEFAIAMHLIVCVSRKNLPMPKALPFSLKSLKQQQQTHVPAGLQQTEMPPVPALEQQQLSISIPEPAPTNRMHKHTGDLPTMSGFIGMSQSNMQAGPPLGNPGCMDISEAFDGLNNSPGVDEMFGRPPLTHRSGTEASTNTEPPYGRTGVGAASAMPVERSPRLHPTSPPPPSFLLPPRIHGVPEASLDATISEPEPKSSEALAQSYNMSDSVGELEKLKTVLQKLQAENLSLKAQLGTMSEEEKAVQRQINATVTEIGDLSNRLTTLRAQVLASKSRLLEATAELKASQEKKGVLNDLIGEAEATKDAIDMAYRGLEASVDPAQAPPLPPAPSAAYEVDLFAFMPQEPAPAMMAPTYEANTGCPQAVGPATFPAPDPAPAPFPYGHNEFGAVPGPGVGPGGQHQIETVSSDETSNDEQESFDDNAQAQGGQQEELFAYNQTSAPANLYQYNGYGGQDMSTAQASTYGIEDTGAHHGISFEHNFRPNPPIHNKQASIGSNLSFEVMGGGPVLENQFSHHHQEDNIFDNDEDIVLATSMEEVNELKSKAKEAEDLARDSESTLRHLMSKADKLRKVADEAEVGARLKIAEATEKKGGFMSGGKKKKSMKEATQAKHDAEAKKKQFLAAQAQANDAQAVAMETKREAEKLRKQAEQAELDAVAAVSMQLKQPEPEPAPTPPMHPQPTNGHQSHGQDFGPPQRYGQPMQGPHQRQGGYSGGYVQPPSSSYGQFNPSVMGTPNRGGVEIPSPAGGGDPYANPF